VKTICHHDEFHQVIVGWRTGGLDNEYVLTSNVILYLYADFSIAESGDFRITHFNSEPVSHSTGKNPMCITREDF